MIKFNTKLISKIYANICSVCINEDLNIPLSSQLQCSSSHNLWIFSLLSSTFFFLNIKSTNIPTIIAIPSFINSIVIIVPTGTASDINIGSISSDVERNIAINVPIVTILPAYRLDAAAENPHCGTIPKSPPKTGPNLPAF